MSSHVSTEQLHDDENYHGITYSVVSRGETMPHVKCCNDHKTGELHLSSPIKKKNKWNYTPKIFLLAIKVACFATVKIVGYTKNERWINNKHWPLILGGWVVNAVEAFVGSGSPSSLRWWPNTKITEITVLPEFSLLEIRPSIYKWVCHSVGQQESILTYT